MATATTTPACKHLVLDAGPLLSLSPLRGLAETFYTVPQVLDELKDKRAREHFERLGLSAGVHIQVQGPDAASLAHTIQYAKKTGDYAVLSHADLCVLALTYSLDVRDKEAAKTLSESHTEKTVNPLTSSEVKTEQSAPVEMNPAVDEEDSGESAEEPPVSDTPEDEDDADEDIASNDSAPELERDDEQEREPLDVELHPVQDHEVRKDTTQSPAAEPAHPSDPSDLPLHEAVSPPLFDDPSDSDDGEGEWITPSNVALHKSRALDLLPSAADNGRKGRRHGKQETIPVGCMTADFAMQNVLLQMGLGLVGVEGKRIERVKSWVLRCHACFKICKDNSRKFCPSCGNPTLLRASVTISSPNAGPNTPALQVHLKKNFQYKTRGTIFSIPAPKPGSAKTGPGEGLILREDQTAWVRAKKHADGKREREERRLFSAASRSAVMGEGGAVLGSWMDPDWVPEIMSASAGGKGRSIRSAGMDGDMPVIGHGRKNPNERKRRK
ncbi:Nin one binding Zn-ribbon like-domain-containing protein [Amylocystis lapponica]|nr:Nin one binding Zn-ribbon like-domain-containing protein [Amylocystis lapponica]